MIASLRARLFVLAVLAGIALAPPAVAQTQIYVNEFYRSGTLGTAVAGTDEWIELVLQVPLTAAQLDTFFVGDSTAATAAKFSGYKFTNMASIAANFPAGTIIVIAGTAGPASDLSYNPAGNDWNITLKTSGTNLTSNASIGDFAATDVAYVDTNGTNGNATLATSGFAVNWDSTPGVFGTVASVTIAVPGNTTAAVLTTGLNTATTPGNWTVGVTLGSTTPGQPNGGTNTTYIQALRGAGLPNLTVTDVSQAETNAGTTTFTFQVNLSAPAGPGGVTFDIATADGTAEDDTPAVSEDNDYVGQSLTGQTITAGNASFPFNVTVNGDVVPESNENFFVDVSNVVGATPTDPQGEGTITNDDVACATLSINDVTQVETDAGTTTFAFTVSLSQAGCGTVTFDIATQDSSATTADNDYVGQTLTGQTITFPSTYTFNVTVNGDVTTEPDQTFFVNLTSVSPVNVQVGDDQGLGTIVNDDFTRIHDIQGPGATSPLAGIVTTRGIVTGRKSNGYFIQEPDASADGNPLTSEGIFVFTSAAPPAAAAMGALVEVTGTVAEFVPITDPQQPPATELTSPTTVQLSTGNPLPTAFTLTATFPDPAGAFDQLERLEGMRVLAASITATEPSDGSVSEANNTGTSNGRFHGVITGVARPFREPGIRQPDVPPVGSIPPIPRWDTNPECLRIETATITGQPALTVKTGDIVAPVTGPLDYSFRGYAIYPDGTLGTPVITPGTLPTTVATPAANEVTVASFNMFHFFDNADDPGVSDVVLTLAAYNDRLLKASIAIRNHLMFPDILAVQEFDNLNTLTDLATQIMNDAASNSQPIPFYDAYLMEGNDIGGIDVGFLVKTATVPGGAARVAVNSVVQIGAADTWIDPDDGLSALLNDRPSLVLDAVVNRGPGASFPIIVINNHLRSLIGIDSQAPDGATTEGDRVRRKRQTQADRLAAYIQTRLTTTPGEHIVLVGDFNSFNFNDGYADTINTISGTPPPDNQTVVCAICPTLPNTNDGVDQVNPDMVNLVNTPPPAERYSYVFDGNAQNLDHAIISAGLVTDTTARRIEHPRIDADYPETERANNTTALRISDHDPVVAFLAPGVFAIADLVVTKTDSPDPVTAGTNLTYTITVTNNGPDAAATTQWDDLLPTGTTFVSQPAVAGWSCTTPAIGAAGTVSCTNPSFAVGSSVFTLTVAVDPSVAALTLLTNNATVTSTTVDGNGGDETGTATTTVAASADLSVTKVDTPDPVLAGSNITYTITITNAGPSNSATATMSDDLPVETTFVSVVAPGGWACTAPGVGFNGTVQCQNPSFGIGSAVFTLTVNVIPSTAAGTVITNIAGPTSATSDPNSSNNNGTATTTVSILSADLAVTKTDSPDPVTAGTNLTYTITVHNSGPDTAGATLSDTLPANTSFVSISTPAGWSCPTQPAVGAGGLVQCSNATMTIGNPVFTLTVAVDADAGGGTTLSNTATVTSTVSDPSTGNESDTEDTTVISPATLTATKTAAGTLAPGSTVTYTIVISNAGPAAQTDNPGDELVDVLPAQLTLISANATSGTAVATIGTNTVTWNGAIPAAGSVTITIQALIEANVPVGTTINNQGTINYDADGNGTNEASAVTDDPSQGGSGNSTGFVVAAATLADVPALDGFGLAALAALLAGLGLLVVRRS